DLTALATGPKQRRSAGTYERARLKELPDGPGVYLLKDADGNVFYVGKSIHVRRRVRDHLGGKTEGQPKLRRHLKTLADVQAFSTGSELEALLLEAKLIKQYLPVANQQLRETTHYPFIRIDVQSPYPRVTLTRAPAPDGSLYFGPFRSARLVGGVVDYLRGLLGIRECERPASLLPDGRPCLLYDLKKCLGPCIGAVTPDDYRPAVDRAIGLLRGEWTEINDGLEARMYELAEREQFEAAAEIRDVLGELRSVVGTHRRLAEMSAYDGIILGPAEGGDCPALFVRGGRLAHRATLAMPTDRRRLGILCRQVYGGPRPGPITQETVDEAWILAAWIRQHTSDPRYAIVDVDPGNLKPALTLVQESLRAWSTIPSSPASSG
ncbi:MAG TPA: GIY-YIG nuclease family protein, partial [Dehalococcoidia bacterium]|nr:GIY-YIG nuclease family protein [Dehalococcoidia bacterium]